MVERPGAIIADRPMTERPGPGRHFCRCLSRRFLIRLPQLAMSHQAPTRLWERS
jgi:hypothetical protein